MRPTEIAQTSDMTEAFHAIYTDSEMMHLWLATAPTLRAKLDRARTCYGTAVAPQGRFGLSEVPADVLALIEAFMHELETRVAPVRQTVRALRVQGLTWDEVWGRLDRAHGFGQGDSRLLGLR